MFEVTPGKLRDFQLCRFLYRERFIDKTPERLPPMRDQMPKEFDEAILKVIKYAYFETLEDQFPSYNMLMYKWRHLFLEGMTQEQIMTEQTDPGKSRHFYNTEGIKILLRFYEQYSRNPGRVVYFNERYTVPLDDGIVATGKLDLVLERDGRIFIPHFTTKTHATFRRGTIGWHKAVLDSIAYRNKVGHPESHVEFIQLKKGKSEYTVISDLEIRQTVELAREMSTAKVFPASVGCYYCNTCQFSVDCANW